MSECTVDLVTVVSALNFIPPLTFFQNLYYA